MEGILFNMLNIPCVQQNRKTKPLLFLKNIAIIVFKELSFKEGRKLPLLVDSVWLLLVHAGDSCADAVLQALVFDLCRQCSLRAFRMLWVF